MRSGSRTSATSPPHSLTWTRPQFAFAKRTRTTVSTIQNSVFKNCIRALRPEAYGAARARATADGSADLRLERVEERLDGGQPGPLLRENGAERVALQPRDEARRQVRAF